MQYKFFIQDPHNRESHYLIETIIEQLNMSQTSIWKGIFAFATRSGIENLLEDEDVRKFLNRGNTDLIIGIDAITDDLALEKLREIENDYDNFSIRVFDKRMQGIFHPKVAIFNRTNGIVAVIVGSGNLTPGGLKNNIEAYSIFITEPDEEIDMGDLDQFLEIHSDSLREIDDEIIERARQNKVRRRRRRIIEEIEPEEPIEDEEEIIPVEENSRVLVAEVPRAGDRWHQIHFNVDVNNLFFRVTPNSSQRAFLFEKLSLTQIGPEEVRPVVFSSTNRNIRIEFAAKRDASYPITGRPILVVREIGTRIFHYILLLPGEEGHREMDEFLDTHPTIGRGLRRCITTYNEIIAVWDACIL